MRNHSLLQSLKNLERSFLFTLILIRSFKVHRANLRKYKSMGRFFVIWPWYNDLVNFIEGFKKEIG